MMRPSEQIFTGKKRKLILMKLTEKYGLRCWYCGNRFEGQSGICIDHIKPISKGGTNDLDNLALSCKYCNTHKFYFPVESFLKYLAYIRTGEFECLILKQYTDRVSFRVADILSKGFYSEEYKKFEVLPCPHCNRIIEDLPKLIVNSPNLIG